MKKMMYVGLLFLYIVIFTYTVAADINGSEMINDPWNTTWGPWTDLFENIFGAGLGNMFYLIPVIVLTFGVYIKTQNPIMTSMFMIGSGALLGSAGIFLGAPDIGMAFTIFTALGIVGLIGSVLFQR